MEENLTTGRSTKKDSDIVANDVDLAKDRSGRVRGKV